MSDTPINDGGPAFPNQPLDAQGNPCNAAQEGMSLRDYFAANARIRPSDQDSFAEGLLAGETIAEYIARARYAYADAMIKQREKRT